MRKETYHNYNISLVIFLFRGTVYGWQGVWSWKQRTAHGPLARYVNCGLRMHRECQERLPGHRRQRITLVNEPGMHHGTCVTHVPWCMSGSLTRVDRENVPGIPGACATRNFTYLVRGPWDINEPAYQLTGPGEKCRFKIWISNYSDDNLQGPVSIYVSRLTAKEIPRPSYLYNMECIGLLHWNGVLAISNVQ